MIKEAFHILHSESESKANMLVGYSHCGLELYSSRYFFPDIKTALEAIKSNLSERLCKICMKKLNIKN